MPRQWILPSTAPPRKTLCFKCGEEGHYKRRCKSAPNARKRSSASRSSNLATSSADGHLKSDVKLLKKNCAQPKQNAAECGSRPSYASVVLSVKSSENKAGASDPAVEQMSQATVSAAFWKSEEGQEVMRKLRELDTYKQSMPVLEKAVDALQKLASVHLLRRKCVPPML
jgi:hypothetical protein